jgi:curved DNA-binding protein CbpA
VATTVASIGQQTYFEILGIEPDSPSSEVQSSYFELARLWHPDRIPAELSDLKPQVSRVFARINEAFQTLSHPERRAEYTELVRSGGGTTRDREILERAVDSAMLFQKGEIYFKKGDYAQAEMHVRQAVEADPEQPEYTALLAWIQAHRLEATPAHRHDYSRQIHMLDEVIEKDPEYERARFYRGTLLKRSGKLDAAHADFRAVVKLNPRNIDAAREVRLFQMRKRDAPDGLLGRLFKKK